MPRTGAIGGFCKDRRGAAAVEFALTATIFLSVCLGIVELGRFIAMQQALVEAVFAGGRYAIVHGAESSSPASASTIQTQVQNNGGILTPSVISATVTFSPDNSPGSTVTIAATYPWSPLVPLLKLPSATIRAYSVATILH
jgi:Flp pilus assembly protein TadG